MDAEGTALVTGASRGLGRAIAVALDRRGFDVVATMRVPADGEGLPEGIRVQRLDVDDPDTIDVPDGLRVLVNNAGVEDAYLPVETAPDALWRRVFETNLFGLLSVTRAAIPALRAGGGGVIANVTSSSILAPVPFYAAYRASKAAVSVMGESLRSEVAGFGIRVVEILPGPIDTDMLALSDRPPEAGEVPGYEALAEVMHRSRRDAGAMTTPADVAAEAVVDAVCDDGGPLRYGCDDLARGLLDAWRTTSDEDLARAMLDGFGVELPKRPLG
jgi:NAD(P)-dependent dehydrogenase (short-subunit alcohol dehydrogenase family)